MYLKLKIGDRLPSVALAQARLVDRGETGLVVDGIFGPKTELAVKSFQTKIGIPVTGLIDETMWEAFNYDKPLVMVDVIDASDISVLTDDQPYLRRGTSHVEVNFGMTKGTRTMIEHLLDRYPPRSVSVLRFHGHGSPGVMSISSEKTPFETDGVTTSQLHHLHFKAPKSRAFLSKIGTIMKPYGSIEMHGCNIASGQAGRRLLTGMSDACNVPVTAGLRVQIGGELANRFEGPVVTICPMGELLSTWAVRRFSTCTW